MMASSLPLVTNGLRHPPQQQSPRVVLQSEDPTEWCAWAHQGHRLWVAMPDSFWVYTYKVDRCPFRGNHVWTTCPYAHWGERARRRDPSRYAYAAATCPDYADSKRRNRLAGSTAPPTCARGLRCGFAHGVFETWLHPTRFRTRMCEAGAGCSRRVCFFAHCLAQRRREDDLVLPLVVFPAITVPPPLPLPLPLPPLAFVVPNNPLPPVPPSLPFPCPRSVSVVAARQVDRVTQAMQQGRSVRLLTRADADAASSSSSYFSSSRAPASNAAVATAPGDDEDIDIVAIVTGCCLASEEESKAAGGGDYPHLDLNLIMDIVRMN